MTTFFSEIQHRKTWFVRTQGEIIGLQYPSYLSLLGQSHSNFSPCFCAVYRAGGLAKLIYTSGAYKSRLGISSNQSVGFPCFVLPYSVQTAGVVDFWDGSCKVLSRAALVWFYFGRLRFSKAHTMDAVINPYSPWFSVKPGLAHGQ